MRSTVCQRFTYLNFVVEWIIFNYILILVQLRIFPWVKTISVFFKCRNKIRSRIYTSLVCKLSWPFFSPLVCMEFKIYFRRHLKRKKDDSRTPVVFGAEKPSLNGDIEHGNTVNSYASVDWIAYRNKTNTSVFLIFAVYMCMCIGHSHILCAAYKTVIHSTVHTISTGCVDWSGV